MAKRKINTKSAEEPALPEGFCWGRDINPEAMQYGQIAITPEGQPHAYLGYFDLDHHSRAFLYAMCVGDRSPQARKSYKFLQLRAGGLSLSSFLWDNTPFKVLQDRRLALPRSTDNTFGVVTDKRELDESMTRALFGATFDELDEFVGKFYAAIRRPIPPDWHWKPARITFSKSRDNDCDLTGVHIPKEFPFIVFEDTQYFGGHISLSGFYRHLAFLCHYRQGSGGTIKGEAFFNRLVEAGVKPELIVQLCQAAFTISRPLINPTGALLQQYADEERCKLY